LAVPSTYAARGSRGWSGAVEALSQHPNRLGPAGVLRHGLEAANLSLEVMTRSHTGPARRNQDWALGAVA
jgi:hypothetical protein